MEGQARSAAESAGSSNSSSGCPRIYTRAEWGAREPKGRVRIDDGVRQQVIKIPQWVR